MVYFGLADAPDPPGAATRSNDMEQRLRELEQRVDEQAREIDALRDEVGRSGAR